MEEVPQDLRFHVAGHALSPCSLLDPGSLVSLSAAGLRGGMPTDDARMAAVARRGGPCRYIVSISGIPLLPCGLNAVRRWSL